MKPYFTRNKCIKKEKENVVRLFVRTAFYSFLFVNFVLFTWANSQAKCCLYSYDLDNGRSIVYLFMNWYLSVDVVNEM